MKAMRAIQTAGAASVLAMCGSVVLAQSNSAAGGSAAAKTSPDAGTRIAAINMRVAIANTAEGKQAAAQLETEFQARRKELDDLSKKINELQQKLTASGTVLNDEEKNKLTLEGQRLTRQLDRRQTEFQEDLNDAQNEVISRIGRKIVDVLGKYAPTNGFGAVLDDSSQTTPVMYAATDITEAVVKLYDQSYPLKAGASPAVAKTPGKPSGQ